MLDSSFKWATKTPGYGTSISYSDYVYVNGIKVRLAREIIKSGIPSTLYTKKGRHAGFHEITIKDEVQVMVDAWIRCYSQTMQLREFLRKTFGTMNSQNILG